MQNAKMALVLMKEATRILENSNNADDSIKKPYIQAAIGMITEAKHLLVALENSTALTHAAETAKKPIHAVGAG